MEQRERSRQPTVGDGGEDEKGQIENRWNKNRWVKKTGIELRAERKMQRNEEKGLLCVRTI